MIWQAHGAALLQLRRRLLALRAVRAPQGLVEGVVIGARVAHVLKLLEAGFRDGGGPTVRASTLQHAKRVRALRLHL